jgi:hypothetical protein
VQERPEIRSRALCRINFHPVGEACGDVADALRVADWLTFGQVQPLAQPDRQFGCRQRVKPLGAPRDRHRQVVERQHRTAWIAAVTYHGRSA